MKARRVETLNDVTEPGDYCFLADGGTGKPTVYFMLPNAKPIGPAHRSLHCVTEPPHTIRECADGSIEVRASIGAGRVPELDGPGDDFIWHGYLDEGHIWREC